MKVSRAQKRICKFRISILVRNWLLSTFSESCQSNQKSQSSNRRGLKGVATGISAAIRMERIMWGFGQYQITGLLIF